MTTVVGMKALASSGVVLPLPHAAGMQSSLPILEKNYKFSKVFFWGKIMGQKGEYLVAKGIEESYATKKFFYCTDGVTWSQLPAMTAEMAEAVAKVSTFGLQLSGDISAALEIPADPVPEGEETDEPPEPKFVTEIERLAVIVETIDNECAMCPAGALMQKADHTIVPSPTYAGQSFDVASNIKSFVFINQPKPTDVAAPALKAQTDFLTSCADVVPSGALTSSFDAGSNVVTWRSLLYPGFLAYSCVGMPVHGCCYVGTGLKNTDIAFMLP
eukprot:CAMPEP_0115845772 /NCGR_PEP_ID=MMETSP0287-20121206/9526_1 /TAXON_ID=412157 /ORGANISM="Chrysochromulina rotalis, Strain UIO044" /LENGTH=271 /DNA_ID=CAMNT_0003299559 /DNA_START=36 /DNA_END=851 /DNA_ORIENTATION=+